MRPVVQKALARVVAEIRKQGLLEWSELMTRLSELEWRLAAAPWLAVFNAEGGKMITGKDNAELLCALLHAHLAPASQLSIKRARKEYKELRGSAYPVSEEDLAKRVPKGEKGEVGSTPPKAGANGPAFKELSENPDYVELPLDPETEATGKQIFGGEAEPAESRSDAATGVKPGGGE